MRGHVDTKQCEDGETRKAQHEAATASVWSLDKHFTAYGTKLERVEVFKYLDRLIAFDGNETPGPWNNLMKTRRVWARISHVLQAEIASPRVCGMF